MFKRVTRGWLLRAGIVSAMGAAAILAAVTVGGGRDTTQAASAMSWVITGGGTQPVGGSFNVQTDATDNTAVVWGGYSLQVAYNPAILQVTAVNAGGLAGCSGANWANAQMAPTVVDGCFAQSTTASSPPPSDIITFQCIAAGSSPIHFVTTVEDPIQGSSFFDENAVNIPTDLTDGSVNCVLPISKSHAGGGTLLAGTTVTYTIHVGNPGGSSSFGHSVTDTFPAPLTNVTFVSGTPGYNAFGGSCGVVANTLTCTNVAVSPDPTGLDLVVSADIPLSAAGTNGVCNTATIDGAGQSNNDCFNVASASVSVTKTADAASYQAGDPISWTITVTSNGPSTAAGVTVTDTPTDGWTVTGNTGGGPCVPATNTTWNCGDMASGATATFTISGNVNDPNPSDNTCDNSVNVSSTNGASASATASTNCLSKNVRMVKSSDCNTAPTNSGELINLFLTKPVTPLTICEWALNVGGDPDGVGAFEFQLKYDNHIFDIAIQATNWLYDTGRVPGAPGIGGCAATILTENDVRFGCVSKNPVDGNGNPIVTTGNKTDGVIATITVTPKSDLLFRITPGNDNGAIRSLLDEGCEFADIWGHPLSTGQTDALGREIPLPGIAPGGQVIDCADVTITVRILEGDMNTDCVVDVADDQLEASHYGGTFGTFFYDPWFDLEPALKDGDVDIKDLQKVFGRNGSTCENPVPDQDPLPQPGDP